VEKSGFEFLLKSSESSVFGNIARVCGSGRVSDWMEDTKRAELLKKIQAGKELCTKNIGEKFIAFKKDYYQNALKPSLAKFKDFLTKYYKRADSLDDLTALFGAENTFIHGQLKATTPQNAQFVTSFSTGQFRGLGVIDNFKRANGSRMPASIISE
jgi:hypothetical protein